MGDIRPTSESARILVSAQMLVSLTLFRVLSLQLLIVSLTLQIKNSVSLAAVSLQAFGAFVAWRGGS
jgi:hypothetical protein